MSGFGEDDPREMPPHFFAGSLRLDFATAVRAGTDRQQCSICPRYWYVDAEFACARCGRRFLFSANEQRVWFEDYGFWVDSLPRHCFDCRRDLRVLKRVRQEYDRDIEQALGGADLARKQRLAAVIDQLYEMGGELPARVTENRRRLARQIARAGRADRLDPSDPG